MWALLSAGHSNSKHCVFAAFYTSDPEVRWIVVGSEDHSVYMYDVNKKEVGAPDKQRAHLMKHGLAKGA